MGNIFAGTAMALSAFTAPSVAFAAFKPKWAEAPAAPTREVSPPADAQLLGAPSTETVNQAIIGEDDGIPFTDDDAFVQGAGNEGALPQLIPGITNEGLTFIVLVIVLLVGLVAILLRGWAMNDEYARIEAATRKAAKMRGDAPDEPGDNKAGSEPMLEKGSESFASRAEAMHSKTRGE